MAKLGQDIIGTSGLAPFFKLSNADEVSITAPETRKGDALRTWVDVPGSKLKVGGAMKAGIDLLALGARVKREGPDGFFP